MTYDTQQFYNNAIAILIGVGGCRALLSPANTVDADGALPVARARDNHS
jgi:hypothetical protein